MSPQNQTNGLIYNSNIIIEISPKERAVDTRTWSTELLLKFNTKNIYIVKGLEINVPSNGITELDYANEAKYKKRQ